MEHEKQIVVALLHSLAARDRATAQHSLRVARLAHAIGQEIGLGRSALGTLVAGALLHDIGKMGIPDAILRKPTSLTDDEWRIMQQHPQIGARITRSLQFSPAVTQIVMYHHERWDGAGYPTGRAALAIPLAARIVAVADAFDAMTQDRPYQAGLVRDVACHHLATGAGMQWDATVVDAALAVLDRPRARAVGAGA